MRIEIEQINLIEQDTRLKKAEGTHGDEWKAPQTTAKTAITKKIDELKNMGLKTILNIRLVYFQILGMLKSSVKLKIVKVRTSKHPNFVNFGSPFRPHVNAWGAELVRVKAHLLMRPEHPHYSRR